VPKEFLLFYMCQLWALHVVIKRQFFYIYYNKDQMWFRQLSWSFCIPCFHNFRKAEGTQKFRGEFPGKHVRTAASSSYPTVIDCGAPQGSVLGPILLLANVNSRSRSLCAIARPSVVCLWRSCSLLSRLKFSAIFLRRFLPWSSTWHSLKILRNSSQWHPSVGGWNARGVAKYGDFWHIECYNSETVQDRT